MKKAIILYLASVFLRQKKKKEQGIANKKWSVPRLRRDWREGRVVSDVGLTRSGEEALILIKRVCATAPNLRGGNALKEQPESPKWVQLGLIKE